MFTMLLDKVFKPFIEDKPIAVMARAALQHMLDPLRIDQLFARTAQRQYTNELLFSSLVQLMSLVVLKQQPSVLAAYRHLQEHIPVSDQAVYDKLKNVELAVSAALVEDSARRVAPVIRALRGALPPLLPGYHVKFLDGNHLAATQHRLAELRETWAAPLPGTVLTVLDQELMTVTNVVPIEDGEAQERAALPQIYPLVRRDEIWVADRNFCTMGFIWAIMERHGYLVFRQHGSLQGKALGRRRYKGRCATGQVYEQRLRLCNEAREKKVVRRVTVVLDKPTRDGDTEIHILTNLPAKVSAARVADLYRQRWTIEGLFLEVSQTLGCEIDTLAYPKAALFAFCLGLLACNAVALVKAALRAEHGVEEIQDKLSAYYVALEIQQTYAGMMVAIPPVYWQVFNDLSAVQMAKVLRHIAGHVVLRRYRKSRRGPKKPPPQRRRYRNGEHIATAKVIAERLRR
jgi:hypothetical protein